MLDKEIESVEDNPITEVKKLREYTDGCVYADTCQSYNCMGRSCDTYSLVKEEGKMGKEFKELDSALLNSKFQHSDLVDTERHLPGFIKRMMQINEAMSKKEHKKIIDEINNSVGVHRRRKG